MHTPHREVGQERSEHQGGGPLGLAGPPEGIQEAEARGAQQMGKIQGRDWQNHSSRKDLVTKGLGKKRSHPRGPEAGPPGPRG